MLLILICRILYNMMANVIYWMRKKILCSGLRYHSYLYKIGAFKKEPASFACKVPENMWKILEAAEPYSRTQWYCANTPFQPMFTSLWKHTNLCLCMATFYSNINVWRFLIFEHLKISSMKSDRAFTEPSHLYCLYVDWISALFSEFYYNIFRVLSILK